ncbi:DMT family transporter [Ammoniphilus resinae]|uniref:Drug/metabolite transporter (DMT)-like permease n=1 Tax=Ammoniphilus resinae TaxID=861532 RepID=A0ABS4GPC5_9BACL|nr:DMT family transporter [Ammoniphilus resinae]MBP1932129.1 drug/metabolite transporter (DMT)-like permease [Ammoniphilus resinae]
METKTLKGRSALFIAFLVFVWGLNWPLAKIALSYSPPLLFAGLRTLLGGVALLPFLMLRSKQIRWRENWNKYLIASVFNIALFYGLQTVGLNYLSSGLFSVIVFLQPVLVGIFSSIWLGESMTALKILGLFLGFSGVAVISINGLAGQISAVGILLALGTSLCWAIGTVYVKKACEGVDPICLVALQLTIGGILLTGSGSFAESWADIAWQLPFVFILLFISIFVIAAGWWVFFLLIGSGEASKVSSYTFLIPLVAITMGTLFLGEELSLFLLVGLVMIVMSIYFINRKPSVIRKREEKVESMG